MKVVITGGGGFLGNQLARAVAKRNSLIGPSGNRENIDVLRLVDVDFSDVAKSGFEDFGGEVQFITGDVSNRDLVFSAIDCDDISVFHLASIVSGDGEKHFDRAMRVNIDGGRDVFEACRARASTPRVLFASSIAVFGGDDITATVSDFTKPNPETTYGMTKFMCEMMINDYSRRGFFDGRGLRLPTIFIRPGKPNAAASSFASGLFREPLNGETCDLPVSRDQEVPLLGYRRVVRSFIDLHDIDPSKLGSDRNFVLPSLTNTVAELIEVLERVAAKHGIALGPILDNPDPVIRKIVDRWPTATDAKRAIDLGLRGDDSVEQVIEDYLEDFAAVSR